jgi:hypothetical protein
VLALVVGDDHPQPPVLLHDVDALDINLLELLILFLRRERRQQEHAAQERGGDGVDFQKANFLLKPAFHLDNPPHEKFCPRTDTPPRLSRTN